jgi:hypothetical protein
MKQSDYLTQVTSAKTVEDLEKILYDAVADEELIAKDFCKLLQKVEIKKNIFIHGYKERKK